MNRRPPPPPPDPLFTFKGSQGPITSLLFQILGSDEKLYAGTQEGHVCGWNLKKSRTDFVIDAHRGSCLSIQSVGDSVVTQGRNDSVKVWSVGVDTLRERYKIPNEHPGYCKCDAAGNTAIIGIPSRTESCVDILDLNSGNLLFSLKPSGNDTRGMVMCFKFIFLAGNQFALCAYESGHIYLWDLKTEKAVSTVKVADNPMCMDFDSTLCQGVCGKSSNEISIFTIDESRNLCPKSTLSITNPGVSCVKIRPDSRIFVTGGWDGRIRVFSWKKLKPLAVLDFHKETIQDLAFSSAVVTEWNCPCVLAAGSKDKRISLWDVYNK